ncbi:recombinase family protein [Jutongia huaianensis]|uniref:Recombinase family protein n=1 Tax=Jutongia huaianensis TaxID=2763668 RepID=A0ABR7MX98_9FIRM|nr:recombinase family protein [Jutongia huaianensis]MBC8561029.1 recombinase family protein [Jutongia huaianensis]
MTQGEKKQGRSFGYARVSSTGQNLDRQLAELRKYVPEENIVTDKMSGKDLERPGYQALKGSLGLRRGDTLYIKSLDRLSRSKADIKAELEWFQKQGIRLMVLDLPTTMIEVPEGQEWIIDMVTNILVEVLASIAEQERQTIRRRQREGIDAAKKRGKKFGRPRKEVKDWDNVYYQWSQKKITAQKAASILKISRTQFYKLVQEEQEEGSDSKR